MAREKKWDSDAERMAAKRAQEKKLEAARALGRRYGEHEVAVLAAGVHPDPEPEARIARAIRYAEWRASFAR